MRRRTQSAAQFTRGPAGPLSHKRKRMAEAVSLSTIPPTASVEPTPLTPPPPPTPPPPWLRSSAATVLYRPCSSAQPLAAMAAPRLPARGASPPLRQWNTKSAFSPSHLPVILTMDFPYAYLRGWVGFLGSTENSLRTAVHPADRLESPAFSCALVLKLVLFSLRGVLNSDLDSSITGWVGFAWYFENSLRNTVHSVDHRESLHFSGDHS